MQQQQQHQMQLVQTSYGRGAAPREYGMLELIETEGSASPTRAARPKLTVVSDQTPVAHEAVRPRGEQQQQQQQVMQRQTQQQHVGHQYPKTSLTP